MLTLKNINKTFGKGDTATEVLKDINLIVKNGEMVCLYGPSGSGKSTLLSIVGALLTPSSGEIDVDGENWTKFSDAQLTELRLKKIGFIFQQANLIPYLTVKDQLVYVGVEAGMDKKQASEHAESLLEEFGLDHRLRHYPKSLSGGEQQRVAIARAFMNNPSLILADEPTASLDYERATQVVETIQRRVKETNTACILITHDSRIFNYADTLYELKAGVLTEKTSVKS